MMPVSSKMSDILESLTFFAFVAITALCLSFTFSMVVYRLGLPANPKMFVLTNLVVSACIAIPTAVIASQHEFRLRIYQRRLEALAATDPLTGLYNRRFFRQALDEELQRMRRTRQTAGVVVFDLDHFKRINDRFGHKTGDVVLTEVAASAFAELRGPFDRLGRWGGEEFVILLSDVTLDQAASVCDRIRARIESLVIEHKGHAISVTASFGVCLLERGDDPEIALETADAALFDSKNAGRNCVTTRGRLDLAA